MRMVDVGAKAPSERRAVARGKLRLSAATLALVRDGIVIEATAATTAPTGVEMEALTAVSVAGLTLYDMVKAVERGARLTDIRLVEKTGGKSGTYRAR